MVHQPRFGRSLVLPLLLLGGVALVFAGASAPVMAAPEPSPVPKRWEVEFQPGPLRMAVVNVPDAGPRAFVYLTYKVTNNGAHDLLFAPTFELACDDMGGTLRSGRDVPVAVTRAILERLSNPLLEDQISIVGTILRGPENAKEGLAVWPLPQMRMAEMTVYAGGFSGETTTLELPGADGQPEKKILRKTHMLRYRLPGEIDPGNGEEYLPFESRPIMR
ncbi:MAG: hypothetical protein WD749_11680 [Phycisphaerales bacterium]